jgi:hypothetical protein
MLRIASVVLAGMLAACSPVDVFAPEPVFGPVQTVQVGGRDYAVREVSNDPVIRAALVAVGTDMGDSMVAGGMPRNGAYDYLDTIRVAGAAGRNVAMTVVAAYCAAQGGSLPMAADGIVARIDPATGEYVFPFVCAMFDAG